MSSKLGNDEDIAIVGAYRTPICKAGKGALSKIKNDVLVSEVIKNTLNKINIEVKNIQEIVFGHCLSPFNGTTALRMGALRAGIPLEVPISTINRQCASSLDAINTIANLLKLDQIEIGLAGGFESMSSYQLPRVDATLMEKDSKNVVDCTLSMGETAEILAIKHNICRNKCDSYAFLSHKRAFEAHTSNKFSNEIVKINYENREITQDDCIRKPDIDKIKSLKPVFREEGVCTAGNSSQLADGASAIVMMKRKTAEKHNLHVKSIVLDYVVVGLEPCVMGEGPIKAIKNLLKRNKLDSKDISYYEINEAFASQAVHCMEELNLDYKNVNLFGGSIALGHPIGNTGSRLVCTLLNIMEINNIRGYAIVSLCVGTGFGAAMLLFRE